MAKLWKVVNKVISREKVVSFVTVTNLLILRVKQEHKYLSPLVSARNKCSSKKSLGNGKTKYYFSVNETANFTANIFAGSVPC
jgi:hypothetical protein